jgi:maltose alpha-D-glucosyltransferase/alpha-amylase
MRLYDRGIRRRFPPMVDGDRRRMELMYSLLFSLPGTPVLFYGEEIGLGDDQRAPDREAVRLPMQWSADDCGGFSTAADASRLPRKPLRDGPFGYRKVNVRSQREDPGSFLNWTERAIRTRKEWPEFGWGEWRILPTRSRAVLAHLVTWDGGNAMAVHNFADTPVRLTLRLPKAAQRDAGWRHLFGVSSTSSTDRQPPPVPAGGKLTVELPPYGYHWFGRREGV